MNIQWHLKNFEFVSPYENVKDYIGDKLSKVRSHVGTLASDEVILVKADLYKEDTKSKDEQYYIKVVFHLPHDRMLIAEERGVTPYEAIDKIEPELMSQIEKYKG